MADIYYKKRYLKEVETFIDGIFDMSGKLCISLDENLFFPGGGGQPKDEGSIRLNGSNICLKVLDVVEEKSDEKESKTFLITDMDFDSSKKILNIGDKVKVSIDWDKRFDYMQQHTGQHLLSGSFFSLFKRNTISLHIGSEVTQLDIEGEFSDEMVRKVEEFANDCISKNLDIKNYELRRDEIPENFTRRPLPNDDEKIRILEIDGVDVNACCGVHLENTLDLQLVKIKKFYRHKGNTRFEFIAGKRAVDFVLKRDRVFDRILNKYNSGFDNIENTLDNVEQKSQKNLESLKLYTEKYFKSLYDSILADEKYDLGIDDLRLIKIVFEEEDRKFISNLSDYIIKNDRAMVFLANITKDSVDLRLEVDRKIANKNNIINLGRDFKEFSNLIDAKGGGSNFLAQGVGYDKKNIDIFLDKIYSMYMR